MELKQTYGPLLNVLPELKEYVNFSEQAFIQASHLGGNSAQDWGKIEARVLSILIYHSLNTSYSIRLLTSFGQSIEAFGLLRIRFEQLIVSSFLIHSDPKNGFNEFISDISRSDYRYSQTIKNIDPKLFGIIEKIFSDNIERAKIKAFFNERAIDPDFDFEKDKLKKSWSNLTKYQMCIERDNLISPDDPLSCIKLSHIYLSIYKSASTFIHCEPGILTENFLSKYNEQPIPNHILIITNLINLAQIDLLQTYEVLKFVKQKGINKHIELYKSYNKSVLRDYDLLVKKVMKIYNITSL